MKTIDWNNLTFRLTATKTMYVAKTTAGKWEGGDFLPFGPLSFSPAAAVLNYGQGLFEGLKAHRMQNGQIALFRPEENAKRFAQGAKRLCIPTVSQEHFLEVMIEIVKRNEEFLPPFGLGSLYLRPCLWGTSPMLGVAPAEEYTFVVFCSPVGNYFKSGEILPVKFDVCENFHRAAPQGVGNIKFIGNYAPTLLQIVDAKSRGFAGTIYLDAVHENYVEEAGVANFFCIKDGVVLTPPLSNTILSGVTRASVIQIAQEKWHLKVREEPLSMEEVLTADECFCTGTAAVVTPIGSLTYQGRETIYQNFKTGDHTQKIYQSLIDIQLGVAEDPWGWIVKVGNLHAYPM